MTSSTSSERKIVLDMVQTQLEESEKENKRLKVKLEKVRKEKEEETELFNKKVEKLQEQFLEVEERVKLKDIKIDEFRKNKESSSHKLYVDLEQQNDELKKHLHLKIEELQKVSNQLEETVVETETIYESLEIQESLNNKSSESLWSQICSCMRCSLVIIFSVALIITILVVLPLKITFTKK